VHRHNGTADIYIVRVVGNPTYSSLLKRVIINDGTIWPDHGLVSGNIPYTLIISVYTDLLPNQCPEVTCPSGFCASLPQVTHSLNWL
jgi:hypothetical protein